MSHSVTLLTTGSNQRGKRLNSSLFTLPTQWAPKYACTFSHVPQNIYESQRTKLDSDLAFYLEWDGISSLLSAVCVRPACPQASGDCPVLTSNTSNLSTRTLWLQTFVLSVWLFHRFSGCKLECSCWHSRNVLSLEPSPQPMIRIVLESSLVSKSLLMTCHFLLTVKALAVCHIEGPFANRGVEKGVATFL